MSTDHLSERLNTKARAAAMEPVADMLAADVGGLPYWVDYNSDRSYQAFLAAKKNGRATLPMKMSDGTMRYMHIRLDENGELPFVVSQKPEISTSSMEG